MSATQWLEDEVRALRARVAELEAQIDLMAGDYLTDLNARERYASKVAAEREALRKALELAEWTLNEVRNSAAYDGHPFRKRIDEEMAKMRDLVEPFDP